MKIATLAVAVAVCGSAGVDGFVASSGAPLLLRMGRGTAGAAAMQAQRDPDAALGRRALLLAAGASFGLGRPSRAAADVTDADSVELAAREAMERMLFSVEQGTLKTERMLAGLERVPTAAAQDSKTEPKSVKFRRLPRIQFIAALGDPTASSGTGADTWGLWEEDPGPRGVRLGAYSKLQKSGGKAPAGWTFDNSNWWLEEHGLIMEAPGKLPAKKFVRDGKLHSLIPAHAYKVVAGS